MSVIIPRNTPDARLRAIPVMLVQEDSITPANINTTGIKLLIRMAGTGGGFSPLSADLVAINATAGEYEVRLTQSETNVDAGNYRGLIPATGNAIQMPFLFQIGPPTTFEEPITPEEFAFVNVQTFDDQSTKLDRPISSMALFPDINEGEGTVQWRDMNGNIVSTGTFQRDPAGRLIRFLPDAQ